MKNFFTKIKKHKGFALLFAVLTASLMLSVGLSIFQLTVKGLELSASSRESQFSFYAADSGTECALYWDLKGNLGATFATSSSDTNVVPSITCGNTTIPITISSSDAKDATTTFSMPLNDSIDRDYCAIVSVGKSDPSGSGISKTNINSLGYNICTFSGEGSNVTAAPTYGNQNLLERALNVVY